MTLLGLATTLTIYPVYLAPALIAIAHASKPDGSLVQQSVKFSLALTVSIGIFLSLSYKVLGSWDFLEFSYGTVIFYTDMTPNIGVWWYFFCEMFEFFRPFFKCVFHLYSAIFSLPLTLRFQSNPLFALVTMVGITSVFKAYPEIGDVGFYLSLLALFKPMFGLLTYPIPVALILLYTSVLGPTFYHLWIDLGSGNSNFFYAITLVHAAGLTIALGDTVWANLRLDHDGGKDPKLCQI